MFNKTEIDEKIRALDEAMDQYQDGHSESIKTKITLLINELVLLIQNAFMAIKSSEDISLHTLSLYQMTILMIERCHLLQEEGIELTGYTDILVDTLEHSLQEKAKAMSIDDIRRDCDAMLNENVDAEYQKTEIGKAHADFSRALTLATNAAESQADDFRALRAQFHAKCKILQAFIDVYKNNYLTRDNLNLSDSQINSIKERLDMIEQEIASFQDQISAIQLPAEPEQQPDVEPIEQAPVQPATQAAEITTVDSPRARTSPQTSESSELSHQEPISEKHLKMLEIIKSVVGVQIERLEKIGTDKSKEKVSEINLALEQLESNFGQYIEEEAERQRVENIASLKCDPKTALKWKFSSNEKSLKTALNMKRTKLPHLFGKNTYETVKAEVRKQFAEYEAEEQADVSPPTVPPRSTL